MDTQQQPLQTIQDIKRMMERSSRFISLSGWSGISAGICALGGAWAAYDRLRAFERYDSKKAGDEYSLVVDLLWIGGITFVAAFISAFIFTYVRSRRNGTPIWDRTVQRLTWNTLLPMAVGGTLILRAMQLSYWELVAPGCLIFYGLALVNASKYTLGEIRFLGYGQLILGMISLFTNTYKPIWYSLFFWAIGFGVLHILYGIIMWWKYERGGSR